MKIKPYFPPPHETEHSLGWSLNLNTPWRSGTYRNYGNVTSKVCQIQMEREKTVLTLNLHHFERPVCKKKKRFSQKSSVETTRSLGLIGCPSAERRSAESSWKWPLVRLVPVKLAHQLLLHGVLDGPPLPRAGLQDQQVAEVNISRHHLQTAPRGSIYDGLVLQGRRRDGVLVFIRFNRWTVNHMWLWRGETGPDAGRWFSFNLLRC